MTGATAAVKPDIPPKPEKDDGQAARRARVLQRQPAFREFDIVNASKSSSHELARVT